MIEKPRCQLVLAVFSLLIVAPLLAQENNSTLVPLSSLLDYTKGKGWASGIGLQMDYSAVFHGSDHYVLELKPEGALQWRNGDHIIFWKGFDLNHTELGWRGLVQDTWLMEVGVQHEIVIPSGRSEKADIENLPHRGSHILGFVDAMYSVGDRWRNWISGRLLAGSNDYGWQAKLSVGQSFLRGLGKCELPSKSYRIGLIQAMAYCNTIHC